MIKKFLSIGLLGTLGLSPNLQAQSSQQPWGIAMHPGLYSYDAFQSGYFKPANYGVGIELSLMRRLSSAFDLGLETGFARLRHPLDPVATAPNQRDNFLNSNLIARFRFDNGSILKKDAILSPFIKAGVGANSFGDFSQWSVFIPAGLGVIARIPNSPLHFILQSSVNYELRANALFAHHSIGIGLNFGQNKQKTKSASSVEVDDNGLVKAPDRDYDGVPDEEDRCPDIFGSPLTMGCPDSDKDGVKDSEDLCVDVKGFANLQGCLDSDYDGVIDPLDQCPDVYGESPDGCPQADASDLDGDGVPNEQDACPELKGLFTAKGCPDADADGIADDKDECPEHFGIAQHKGCPMPKAELERLRLAYEKEKEMERNKPNNGNNRPNFASYSDPKSPNYNPYYNKYSDPDNPEYNTKHPKYSPELDPYSPKYKPDHPGNQYRKNQNNANNNGNNGNNGTWTNSDPKNNLGGNSNPSGYSKGSIFLGNPQSDKFGGIALTGFSPVQEISPADREYCQRLDLTALKSAIYFEYNDSRINTQSLRALDKVVEAMRRCAMLELQIAGHTDSDGSDTKNQGLSEKRAQAVLRYITGQGINDRRLKFNAYGEKYPVVPNTSTQNKQQNRRAEIRIQRAY
jgi:outer membrane protein OmpA-like peptidoglycan-associated protein